MNQFTEDNMEHWFMANELFEALDCFNQGLQKLSFLRYKGSEGSINLWVHSSRSQHWIGGGFAGLCKGVNVWFIPPGWNKSTLASFRERFPPDIVLTDFGWDLEQHTPPSNPLSAKKLELTGKLMIATGGSSGNHKFAIHDSDSMVSAVSGVARQFYGRCFQTGDFNYCNDLPLWHVSGWMQVIRSFISNSSYFTGDFAREKWSELSGGKWISLVPTQLRRMLELKEQFSILQKADFIIVGGGPCPIEILKQCLAQGIHPWVTYGMTETLGMIAGKSIHSVDDLSKGAVVFPHATVEIDGLSASSPHTGKEGEIVVASSSLCSGYIRVPFIEGDCSSMAITHRFSSKDFGCWDEEGGFHVKGRMDDLIITGGEKVSPFEVEEEIRKLEGIKDCIVGAVEDSEWGERVVCLYTSVDRKELDLEDLKQALGNRLEAFKIPKSWCRTQDLLMDEKGKLNRKKLKIRLGEVFA